jgi:hypothetical protein
MLASASQAALRQQILRDEQNFADTAGFRDELRFPAAATGRHEPFKTAQKYDGTAKNPEIARRRRNLSQLSPCGGAD